MTHVPIELRIRDAQSEYSGEGSLKLAEAQPTEAEWEWDATLNIATGDAFCAIRLDLEDLVWLAETVIANDSTPDGEEPTRKDKPEVLIETTHKGGDMHQVEDAELWAGKDNSGDLSILCDHGDVTAEVIVTGGGIDGLARQLASKSDHPREPFGGLRR